jgi:fatty acid desaturase
MPRRRKREDDLLDIDARTVIAYLFPVLAFYVLVTAKWSPPWWAWVIIGLYAAFLILGFANYCWAVYNEYFRDHWR